MLEKNSPRVIILKIAEAESKDVGRAIARVDPKEFSKIGAEIGDTVLLKSKSGSTVLKLMPMFQEMRGQGMAQIDGIARENLGAGLDEKIEVGNILCSEARIVVLAPLNSSISFTGG